MFDATEKMFGKFQLRLGKVKKKDYERIFEGFMGDNRELLCEMLQYISARDDKQEAASEVAKIVYDNMTVQYGKRGKLPKGITIDMSIYLIYYMFPAILKLEDENSKILADALRDEWRVRTKNELFDYTTYEEVHKGFKEKLFGFF